MWHVALSMYVAIKWRKRNIGVISRGYSFNIALARINMWR